MLAVVARSAETPRDTYIMYGVSPGRLADAHTTENTTEGWPNRRYVFPLSSTAPRKGRCASNMQPGHAGHGLAAPKRGPFQDASSSNLGNQAGQQACYACRQACTSVPDTVEEKRKLIGCRRKKRETTRRPCPGKTPPRRSATRAPRRGSPLHPPNMCQNIKSISPFVR